VGGSLGTERLYRRLRRAARTADRYVRFVLRPEHSHRGATLAGACKLMLAARFQPRRTKPIRLVGFEVSYASIELLRYVYREIFVERLYELETDRASLRIIDGGANIGLAMLFFKLVAPDCRVTCFEPDPRNCEIIAANVRGNGLRDVTVRQAALSDVDGTVTMHANAALTGDTAQSLSRTFREHLADKPSRIRSYEVPALSLRPFLDEPVDVLKLDVEGAEGRVIASLGDRLGDVGCVLMEYHYLRAANSLQDIIGLLEAAGHEFRLEAPDGVVSEEGSTAMLFAHRRTSVRPLPRY
jgi:FkbM family methyltransferase